MTKRWREVIDSLAEVKPEVQRQVSAAVMAVLELAEACRSYGADFTFSVSGTLLDSVMELMRGLSEGCLALAERKAREILSWFSVEDPEELLADAESHDNPNGVLWAFDMHSSNLLKVIEVWLVIGFAKGLNTAEIHRSIMGALAAPEASRMWRDAVRSRLVDPQELRFGKGYQRRVVDAITVLVQSIVYTSYLRGAQVEAGESGAEYYVVHRGSSFDCPYCDSRCERPTPMSEPYYPSHPRCVCWLEFVY